MSTMYPFSGLKAVVSRSKTTNSVSPAASALPSLTTESALGPRNGSFLGLPAVATSFSCSSMLCWSSAWPKTIASAMTDSGRILAPASTIITASRVPATTRSRSLSSSWLVVGLVTNSPLMRPTRTAPMGPRNGMLLTASAAEAPLTARMSGSFSWSALSTVRTIWTSCL